MIPTKVSSSLGRPGGAGVYIHIPFCKQACHYCDFHFSTSLKKKAILVNALVKELVLRKEELKNKTVETIYFGGGTPSLLTIDELKELLDTVYENYEVSPDTEITLEANPDDLSAKTLATEDISCKLLREIGINRLSIGIQSFFGQDLKLMNRAHNAEEAKRCLLEACQHFSNISIDLIFGIPGMTNDRWVENIAKALSYNIPHISSYALTVEPGTALEAFIQKGVLPNVDEDMAEAQFQLLSEKLIAAGFEHYEVSNFGKPNYFSRHNTSYWQGKHYLGIGPSAHSFNGYQRSWNVRNNTKYSDALTCGKLPNEVETLTLNDRYNEYVMTGLRTIWGISLDKIEQEFGMDYRKYLITQSKHHIDQHLLYIDGDKILVTKKGRFLSDGIASNLFKTDNS